MKLETRCCFLKVVIMAGGQGTRFWPWSTKEKPKQFLPLTKQDETMLEQTYKRFSGQMPVENIYIITTAQYKNLIKDQLGISDEQILIEPAQRDTGPCMAFCARTFLKKQDDEVFAAVPADHYIPDANELLKALKAAEKIACRSNTIVTLGIKPDRPETGYGYIQCVKKEDSVFRAKAFIEKPSYALAKTLYQMDHVFWNSGIFIWKPSTIAYYMEKFQPELWEPFTKDDEHVQKVYKSLPKISVDYAILEKADNIYTISVDLQWNDVGKWSSLEHFYSSSEEENILIGQVTASDVKNCLVKVDQKHALLIGIQDLIVASTKDGLLICHKSKEHEIKRLLKERDDGT